MKLRGPAARTWREHRAALHALAADDAEPSNLVLGGGSILNARWGHRESIDIDMLLPGRRNAAALRRGGRLDLAAAVGGTTVREKEHRVTVRTPEGVLDVTTMKPELPGLERRIDVEGRSETVLATAQILRGKLARVRTALPRDAFDLITAARADPLALEIAVNSLSAQQRTAAREHLTQANSVIADRATDALAGVPKQYRTPGETMGTDAARTLRNHEYERVQIHRTEDGILVLTFPKHGTPRALDHGHDIDAAIRETGIGEYLDANSTVSSYEVEKTLASLAEKSETGLVLDTADADPGDRKQATAHGDVERPSDAHGDAGMTTHATHEKKTNLDDTYSH